MSDFENDRLYEEKFICANVKDIVKSLNEDELKTLDGLLAKINTVAGDKRYLCINQDEPYAEEVWNIIREHEKREIIAFIGRAGGGKDYQCNLLKEKGFEQLAFADALRDIAYTSLCISDSLNVDYDWLKKFDCIHVSDKDGDEVSFNFRVFLEKLGTQGIRKYDNDFWCKCLLKTLQDKGYKKVCISDMRFINEYNYLWNFAQANGYEFKVIFCDYHSERYQENNTHESARMGNYFATNGYKDLQEITFEDMQKYKEKEE